MAVDIDLATRIRNGDGKAFSQLYDNYHKLIYTFAYKYLRNEDMSKDVVQTIFMKYWENRRSIDEKVNLKLYLLVMTKNLVLNELRSQQNRELREKAYFKAYEDEPDTNEISDDEQSQLDHLKKAISSLPKQRREIYHLKHEDGLSNKEIAHQMHISENTVKSQYTKLLKAVKDMLSQQINPDK